METMIDKDRIRIWLQGGLCRKVSKEEINKFIENGRGYFLDYGDMLTMILEKNHWGDAPYQFLPMESLFFREYCLCITPEEDLKNCLWVYLEEAELSKKEIEELLA